MSCLFPHPERENLAHRTFKRGYLFKEQSKSLLAFTAVFSSCLWTLLSLKYINWP